MLCDRSVRKTDLSVVVFILTSCHGPSKNSDRVPDAQLPGPPFNTSILMGGGVVLTVVKLATRTDLEPRYI